MGKIPLHTSLQQMHKPKMEKCLVLTRQNERFRLSMEMRCSLRVRAGAEPASGGGFTSVFSHLQHLSSLLPSRNRSISQCLQAQIPLSSGQTYHGGFKVKNTHGRWPLQPEECKVAMVLPKGMSSSLLHPGPMEGSVGRGGGCPCQRQAAFPEATGASAPDMLCRMV